ncbi:MAG: redoxin domain-containing protein [Nitrospiraceae bacterium]
MKLLQSTLTDRCMDHVASTSAHAGLIERPRMAVSIGKPVPKLRLTAVVKGEYRCLNPASIAGRWIALCFPASLRTDDLMCLNSQAMFFARAGAVLLGVVSDRMLLQPGSRPEWQDMAVPLLTDPLSRLHRAYGMSSQSAKASTFLIDPSRILRHHIVHELAAWDMEALRGLLMRSVGQGDGAETIVLERSHECRM